MNRPPSIRVDTGFEVDQNGALTEIVFPNVVANLNVPTSVTSYASAVNWLPNTGATLTTLNLPNATSISMRLTSAGIANLSLPKLITLITAQFYGNTHLINVSLPELAAITTDEAFRLCTSLQNVVLGSAGHPVTGIAGGYTFGGCTQGGLTITIYTKNGASLSGSPWGATNATIEYEEA